MTEPPEPRLRTPWRVVHVDPPPAAPPGLPAFSFTSGLDRIDGHPDLLVFDMPGPSAQRFLDRVGERVRAGSRYAGGCLLDDADEVYRLAFVEVTDRCFLLDLGRWDVRRWRRPERPMLQLVWPDICGTFAWEFGYDLAASGLRQPLLGRWPG